MYGYGNHHNSETVHVIFPVSHTLYTLSQTGQLFCQLRSRILLFDRLEPSVYFAGKGFPAMTEKPNLRIVIWISLSCAHEVHVVCNRNNPNPTLFEWMNTMICWLYLSPLHGVCTYLLPLVFHGSTHTHLPRYLRRHINTDISLAVFSVNSYVGHFPWPYCILIDPISLTILARHVLGENIHTGHRYP